jgi:DMSO/TMAO reductase YedYZ molybdopterin-dependent catalytic subunit
MSENPFTGAPGREETTPGVFSEAEVGLANRNSGAFLEMLALDITPVGAHYLLTHFDVPLLEAGAHRLMFSGAFDAPFALSLEEIKAEPRVTMPVTMECAGNGRAGMEPRAFSMPWAYEAVGTAEWTGTPLAPLIERAKPRDGVVDFAFEGADFGYDKRVGHAFGRSLTPEQLAKLDVLLVYEMNGQPLLPQHGAPLRLIVPGWYGMASVKWLNRITAMTERYQGFQQVGTYRFRKSAEEPGEPVTEIKVKSLMVPPGVPDWITRKRRLSPGPVTLQGRAWSGAGVPVERVEVRIDETWHEAKVEKPSGRYAWAGWSLEWEAQPGHYVLACRATDVRGDVQPMEAEWNLSGFANTAPHEVEVFVED